MASQWFHQHDGNKSGPVSSAQLKDMAVRGQIQPSSLIWREGLQDWVEARRVQGLFSDTEDSVAAVSGIHQKSSASAAAPVANDKYPPGFDQPGVTGIGADAPANSTSQTADGSSVSPTPPPLPSQNPASGHQPAAPTQTAARWLKRVVRGFVATCATALVHLISLARIIAAVWKRQSLNKQVFEARLRLGERMFQDGLGDAEIRHKIAALDAQIADIGVGGGSVKALQVEHRGLLIRLAEGGRQFPQVQDEQAGVVTAAVAAEKNEQQLTALHASIWPNHWIKRLQIGASYTAVLAAVVLVILAAGAVGQAAESTYEEAVTAFFACRYQEARAAFLELAEDGNPKAQYFLGVMSKEGLGVPQDDKAAAEWFDQAEPDLQQLAEAGDPIAQTQLAEMYRKYDVTPPAREQPDK